MLAAVLLAAAEQVIAGKLRTFKVERRTDVTLLGLAIAFRGDDTGLLGDVFEWCLLSSINAGDSDITQMAADALGMVGMPTPTPQAVLVAAEKGRLVEFSPAVPRGAKIMSGRPGRPWLVENALAGASTLDWKADVLLGSADRWVTASLKVNPWTVVKSCRDSVATKHPIRIGITPDHPARAGLTRDPKSGAVIMRIPADAMQMALTRAVLTDVKEAFARHLNVPGTPLAEDVSGIGTQLHRWRDWTVAQAVETLQEVSRPFFKMQVSQVMATQTTAQDPADALVAVDPLRPAFVERVGRGPEPRKRIQELLAFSPID